MSSDSAESISLSNLYYLTSFSHLSSLLSGSRWWRWWSLWWWHLPSAGCRITSTSWCLASTGQSIGGSTSNRFTCQSCGSLWVPPCTTPSYTAALTAGMAQIHLLFVSSVVGGTWALDGRWIPSVSRHALLHSTRCDTDVSFRSVFRSLTRLESVLSTYYLVHQ